MQEGGFLPRVASRVASWFRLTLSALWRDRVQVCLPFSRITLDRSSSVGVPHEVTVVIPRAEFRLRRDTTGAVEYEAILSSITIAHSPRPQSPRAEATRGEP